MSLMDTNARSHGDDTKNAVPISSPEPQTASGENQEGTTSDMKRRFPPRKAAVPAKKKPYLWRILRWWLALAAVLAVAATVVLGFYLWQAGSGQEISGVSTQVKVSGQLGEQPVVEFQGRMPITLPNSRVAIRGFGPQIRENQDVRVMVSVYEGDTGKLVSKGGKPQLFVGKANASNLPRGLLTEIVGRNEGSRLIVHRPATASDGKTAMEVDVIDVLPTAVYQSQLQIPEAAGVSFTFPQGLPQFESATETKPQEAATFVLVPGKGEQLDPRKKILVQYGVWELDSGKKRVYTWGNLGPQNIVGESTFQSLSQQLTALRANSRILAIIPADQATGDSALVVVMDVLACAK